LQIPGGAQLVLVCGALQIVKIVGSRAVGIVCSTQNADEKIEVAIRVDVNEHGDIVATGLELPTIHRERLRLHAQIGSWAVAADVRDNQYARLEEITPE
jgi:ABC-type lipopolysaccharide export system ATPase subunit